MRFSLLRSYIKKVIIENYSLEEEEDFTEFTNDEKLANVLKSYNDKHGGRFFIKNKISGLPNNLEDGMSLYDILDYFYDAAESRDSEVWFQNSLGFRELQESLLLREIFGFFKKKKAPQQNKKDEDFKVNPKYIKLTNGDRKLAFALEFFDRYFSTKSKKIINFIRNKIKK